MSSLFFTKQTHKLIPRTEIKNRLKKIIITGISGMPDPEYFYSELIEVFQKQFKKFNSNLFIEFNLDYVNTASVKWLFYLIKQLDQMELNGGLIQVVWVFENDDETIEEIGDLLKEKTNISFIMKAL